MTPSSAQIEQLAASIGDDIYIDVAKWHLYLKDAKIHALLAEKLAPLILTKQVDEAAATQVLDEIKIKLGGGRSELPLSLLLPVQSIINLLDILEEYARKWN